MSMLKRLLFCNRSPRLTSARVPCYTPRMNTQQPKLTPMRMPSVHIDRRLLQFA